jgi:ferredoxin
MVTRTGARVKIRIDEDRCAGRGQRVVNEAVLLCPAAAITVEEESGSR